MPGVLHRPPGGRRPPRSPVSAGQLARSAATTRAGRWPPPRASSPTSPATLGLKLISPPAFMNAVAEGNDPPVSSVVLFEAPAIRPAGCRAGVQQADRHRADHQRPPASPPRIDIPVVGVTETIQPPGQSFEQWFAPPSWAPCPRRAEPGATRCRGTAGSAAAAAAHTGARFTAGGPDRPKARLPAPVIEAAGLASGYRGRDGLVRGRLQRRRR